MTPGVPLIHRCRVRLAVVLPLPFDALGAACGLRSRSRNRRGGGVSGDIFVPHGHVRAGRPSTQGRNIWSHAQPDPGPCPGARWVYTRCPSGASLTLTGPMLADTQAVVQAACRKRASEWSRPTCGGKDSERLQADDMRSRAHSESSLSWHPRQKQNALGGECPARSAC